MPTALERVSSPLGEVFREKTVTWNSILPWGTSKNTECEDQNTSLESDCWMANSSFTSELLCDLSSHTTSLSLYICTSTERK